MQAVASARLDTKRQARVVASERASPVADASMKSSMPSTEHINAIAFNNFYDVRTLNVRLKIVVPCTPAHVHNCLLQRVYIVIDGSTGMQMESRSLTSSSTEII